MPLLPDSLIGAAVMAARFDDALAPEGMARAMDEVDARVMAARLLEVSGFSDTHRYDTLVAMAKAAAMAFEPASTSEEVDVRRRIENARLLFDRTDAELVPLVVHCVIAASLPFAVESSVDNDSDDLCRAVDPETDGVDIGMGTLEQYEYIHAWKWLVLELCRDMLFRLPHASDLDLCELNTMCEPRVEYPHSWQQTLHGEYMRIDDMAEDRTLAQAILHLSLWWRNVLDGFRAALRSRHLSTKKKEDA